MIPSATIGVLQSEATSGRTPCTWLNARRFGIAVVLAIAAVYPGVIIGTQTFVFRDFSIFSYPNAFYHRQCFWQGEIPLWNPLNNCGIPFLAQWNTMTLYPLSLIYLLLPMPWSLNIFCLLHLVLGAVGMFSLASRWTGSHLAGVGAGISFGFCGLMLIALIWPNIIAVLGWMPWVILTVEQGWKEGGVRIWIAAFVAALQMLAGMPEYTLFTWIIVVGVCAVQNLGRNAWRRLATIAIVVSGLIAVQLLPFFELLLESRRNVLFEPGEWALPLWGWANFFVPLFHTRAVPQGIYFPADQPLFTSYYVAIPVLLLAVYATIFVRDRRVWLLATAALLGLWLATGKAGYLYKWLLDLSPAFGFMRYPAKFVALTVVALPLMAAFGLAHWLNRDSFEGASHRRTMIILAVVCGLVISGVMIYAHFYPVPGHDGPPVWWNGLWRLLFLVAATTALLLLKKFDYPKAAMWPSIALLGCVLLDSLTQVPKHYPTAPVQVYAPGVITARLHDPPKAGDSRAMMSRATHDFLYYGMLPDPFDDLIGRRVGLLGNLNLIDNIATPDGFYAMYLPQTREVWNEIFFAHPNRFPAGLADFVGVSHMTSLTNALEWTTRSNAMTFASAGQEPRFVDAKTVLPRLVDSSFDPRKVVYLANEAKGCITVTNQSDARILGRRLQAHRIEFDVEAARPALVVFSQSYYRSWCALVNGQKTPIVCANHGFQALQVPGGRSTVQLVYIDRMFEIGTAISLLTLCALFVGLFRSRRALNIRSSSISPISQVPS